MDNLVLILILCFMFLGSSMCIEAHRDTLKSYNYTSLQAAKNTYDVTNFGAAGDERTDDSKAFTSAWEAACGKGTGNAKVTVPSGKTFLVYPITFVGPCGSRSITFEILGNIVAPPRSAWKNGAQEWLHFYQVDGLTVVGNEQGVIDGRGDTWWKNVGSLSTIQDEEYKGTSNTPPTALRFSHCNKLQVRGLKHRNSQRNHVSINHCNDATISNLEITAPEKSPNTDGIDISSSTNLHIRDSVMATGDDCIAINGGTSNVDISNIKCGPGHGISIGSLGKEGQHDEVEAIRVTKCTFKSTQNGVRIKTWQGGSGFARNITFSDITFIAANNPVIIDQYYCPHKKCTNQTSAVKVSDVRYSGLHGTSISKNATINFSCSQTVPCTNIVLENVDIESTDPQNPTSAHCSNAHGSEDTSTPAVDCLVNKDMQFPVKNT